MAIIIRSSDIYEKNNHNIMLNNAIKSVSVQEKLLEFDEQTNKFIQKNEPVDIVDYSEFDIRTTYNDFSIDPHARLEALYSSGRITIPKSQISVQPMKVQWKIQGEYIKGKYDWGSITPKQAASTDNILFAIPIGDFAGKKESFSQTGLWGENGVIKYKVGSFRIIYNDRSNVKISLDDNNLYIDYFILTALSEVKLGGRNWNWSDYDDITGSVYHAQSIEFYLYYQDVKVEDAKTAVTVGEFSQGNPFALEENQLVQPDTTINGERVAIFNANKVLEDWKDGKENVDLEVAIGDYYETNGEKVISDKDINLPMFFEIGQLVTPYVSETQEVQDGETIYLKTEEVPLSTYENGVAKNFVIYDIQQVNDGIGLQNLKLIESAGRAVTVNTLDGTGSLRIERVLSPIANAKLGYLSAKDAIYKEDAIIITASGDIRNWEILNNGITVEQGDSQTIDVTFVVEGDIDINIHAKEWRWVDYYPDASTSQITFDKPTYPSGISGDYLFRQNKSFENTQIPRYAAGLVANSANHKIWYITPTVYNRVTNSYAKLPEIKVYGSDYVDFAQQYDTPYGEEGFVGSGGVIGCSRYNDSGELILTAQSVVVNPFRTYQGYLRLDVTQNNIVTFTNMALGVSNNFDCYITQIDLAYSQYEYS